MKQVNWSDFKIVPLTDTVRKEDISDEVYFSKEYSNYISNSRLKLINPEQGGSPQAYFEKQFQESTTSLQIGSAVHQLFLQGDEFVLAEGYGKPSAKLGQVVEKTKYYRNNGYTVSDSIQAAAKDVGYYVNGLTENRIAAVLEKGFEYYWKSKELGPQHVVLCNADTEVVKKCLNALSSNKKITKVINAVDLMGDPIDSFNEDAMFMDIQVTYQDTPIILKLKMKADNWTVDVDGQTLTLNDLKTTGKPLPFFMEDYGSFVHFHYARQMAMYSWILKHYCAKHFGYDENWTCESNMVVVETIPPYRADCYKVSKAQIREGMIEMFQLLKRVAYYELFGYEEEVDFI